MARPSLRSQLLEAAAGLVLSEGVATLTLERAADAAGVSKGGLLYHFPTKAALVEALVEDILDRFEVAVDSASDRRGGAASWAHAYVDATFDATVSRPGLAAALLAVPDSGELLLARCATRLEGWHRRLASAGIDSATTALVRYACDGWWTASSVFGERASDTDALRDRLHGLIDEATT